MPLNKTTHLTQVMLQPEYTPTMYKAMLDLPGPTMIFSDPFDKYSQFWPWVVQFRGKKCESNIKIQTTLCHT